MLIEKKYNMLFEVGHRCGSEPISYTASLYYLLKATTYLFLF